MHTAPSAHNPQTASAAAAPPGWRRRQLLGGAALCVGLAASGLILATGPDGAPEAPTETAWPVSVARVAPSELHPMFSSYGRVEARTTARLRADVRATVREVLVREGDWAEAGAVLVRLEREELALNERHAAARVAEQEAALSAANTEYDLLKRSSANYERMHQLSQQKLERQQELAAQRMIPQALLDDALAQASRDSIEYQNHTRALASFPAQIAARHASLEQASAALAQARLELRKSEVRAPFTGPVLDIAVAPGDRSDLGVVLLTLADASSFEVRAAVPPEQAEALRLALHSDQPVTARASGAPLLRLTRLGRSVRPGQSGLDAFFSFEDRSTLPELGRVLNLTASLPARQDLVAIPGQALYDNQRVYRVADNRLEAIAVEPVGEQRGPNDEYQVLVRAEALKGGESILTTRLPRAIDGLLVAPISAGDDAVVIAPPQTSVVPAPAPRV